MIVKTSDRDIRRRQKECSFVSFSKEFPGGSEVKAFTWNVGDPGVPSLGREDPLEKEMATHSSTLAWRIP